MAHCCFQVFLQCLISALTPGGESGLFFGLISSVVQRRQWHPAPVLLPGNSHGRRSLVGCSPWGSEESYTTERLHFHFSLSCIGEGNGNPLQCCCLENPRDGGAWWAAILGVTQSRTRLKGLSSSSSVVLWRGKGTARAARVCGECSVWLGHTGVSLQPEVDGALPRGVGPGLLDPWQSQADRAPSWVLWRLPRS